VIDMADAPAEQSALALINRGVAHRRQGRVEQAIADYTAVTDMADAPAKLRATALGNRSWHRFTSAPPDIPGLRQDSEAALAIAPDLRFARFNLGLALLLSGDVERATEEYAKAAKDAAYTAEIQRNIDDLERALAGHVLPGSEEILALLEQRKMELEAASASRDSASSTT
jgi:tetratricopeptide (TPR) repeat protein